MVAPVLMVWIFSVIHLASAQRYPPSLSSWFAIPQKVAGAYPVYLPHQPIYAAGGSSDYVNSWTDYRNNFYDQTIVEEPAVDPLYDNFAAFLAGKWRPPRRTTTQSPLATNATDAEDSSLDPQEVAQESSDNVQRLQPDAQQKPGSRPERVILQSLIDKFSQQMNETSRFRHPAAQPLVGLLMQSLTGILRSTQPQSTGLFDLDKPAVDALADLALEESRGDAEVASPQPDARFAKPSTARKNATLSPEWAEFLSRLGQLQDVVQPTGRQPDGSQIDKRAENVTRMTNASRSIATRFDFRTLWGNFSVFPFQYTNNLVTNLTVPTGVIKVFDWVRMLSTQTEFAASTQSPPTAATDAPVTQQVDSRLNLVATGSSVLVVSGKEGPPVVAARIGQSLQNIPQQRTPNRWLNAAVGISKSGY